MSFIIQLIFSVVFELGAEWYLILQEYKYISLKRVAYFYSSKPQAHQFTILVRSIPVSAGSSVGDTVENFFTEYYPSTYLSNVVVRRTSRLRGLIVSISSVFLFIFFRF